MLELGHWRETRDSHAYPKIKGSLENLAFPGLSPIIGIPELLCLVAGQQQCARTQDIGRKLRAKNGSSDSYCVKLRFGMFFLGRRSFRTGFNKSERMRADCHKQKQKTQVSPNGQIGVLLGNGPGQATSNGGPFGKKRCTSRAAKSQKSTDRVIFVYFVFCRNYVFLTRFRDQQMKGVRFCTLGDFKKVCFL